MANLIILGTSNAIPYEGHENTHFVLKGESGSVLVDCLGSDTLRLDRAGVPLANLKDIILTHCHPDHISGVPPLLMNLWLLGRRTPLNIYGLQHTLNCVEKMMELYQWEEWPDFFPVSFHTLPAQEMVPVLENDEFRIFSSPVRHILPTIGLRIESPQTGKVIAYSCDTEPCPEVIKLGMGADILLHEATGESYGHSSPAQAGEIAEKAGAKALYLIHYPPKLYRSEDVLNEAKVQFPGEVRFAEDFMVLDF